MRATSLLRTLLALQDTVVTGSELTPEALIVDVKPTWQIGRCSECDRKAPTYDHRSRRWRQLDLGGIKCSLRYDRRRVKCRDCGIKVEAVPWAEAGSRFTRPFEMHTTQGNGRRVPVQARGRGAARARGSPVSGSAHARATHGHAAR